MARIDGIIFDKDGTLFDFHATWSVWADRFLHDLAEGDAAFAARLGRAVGFDTTTKVFDPDSPVIAGTPGEGAALLAPHLPDDVVEGLVERMNREAARAPQVEAVPLAALLAELRGRGLRLGVVTNDAEGPARAHLEAAGVADGFDAIIGSDTGHGAKPDRGPLLAFAEQTGLAPAHVAMIGDSPHDLSAGRGAGMVCVAVLTGPIPADRLNPLADAVLPDIGHLPRWLDDRKSGKV